MKNLLLLITICSLYFISCSSKKETESNSNNAAKQTPKKSDFPDLSGEIIWQQQDRTIQNIPGEYQRVLFTGYYASEINKFSNSLLRQEGNRLLVSGKITKRYDLDKDGVPELILEDITSNSEGIEGTRYVLNIIESSVIIIKSTKVEMNNVGCSSFVGKNELFEFDSLTEGGPYLLSTTNFNYFLGESSQCDALHLASSKTLYTKKQEQYYLDLKSTNECVIVGNNISLAKLYAIQPDKLDKLEYTTITLFEFRYNTAPKLLACGEDQNMGISHLEKLAGLRLQGGQAHKRKDLMPFIEEEFMNVNPAFIKWGRENLIPSPNQKQANGLVYQYIYNKAYKNWLRGLALQKLIIESNGVEQLLVEYTNASSTITYQEDGTKKVDYNSDLYDYIYEKYEWISGELNKQGHENISLDAMDYGFWMRRMLDGSEPEVWETLKYILQLYDGEWYVNTEINYGMSDIDSTTFYQKRAVSDVDNIIMGKEAIPEGILTETKTEYIITARNGKVVKIIKNSNMDNMESRNIDGYWPSEEKIIFYFSGNEGGGTFGVDINSGERSYTGDSFYPSKDGQFIARLTEDLDENSDGSIYISTLTLSKKDGEIFYQNNNIWASGGFWIKDEFYFNINEKVYKKIGKVGFKDLQPYLPPIKETTNQSDSIPTDSSAIN